MYLQYVQQCLAIFRRFPTTNIVFYFAATLSVWARQVLLFSGSLILVCDATCTVGSLTIVLARIIFIYYLKFVFEY